MSEEFFLASPHLQTRPYRPLTSRGTAINGSKVMTLGIVNVAFRINGRFHTANFRVVRGLVQDMFLGWDWFSSAGAMINPVKGTVDFPRFGDSTPLVEDTLSLSGCYYRAPEDLVVPANSKMICKVETMLHGFDHISNVVATDPFNNASSDLWFGRCVSVVTDGLFPSEFINCNDYPVKLEKGRVLGYAQFLSDVDLERLVTKTEMYCHYGGESSSADEHAAPVPKDPDEDDDDIEEIVCDPPSPGEQGDRKAQCVPQDTPPPPNPPSRGSDIPAGAKKLKLDLSNISKDAIPHKAELKHLLEVKHAKAFSVHDRDYGRTNLTYFRANLKDKNLPPIAVPPFRTTPEMRQTIDNQAYQMIADGVISHSTSPFSAPIMLAKKKCGGWRFLTDFRRINERCEKIVYPLPRIEDSLQKLDNPQIFSSLDLTKGFWQVPIHPEDRKYFAFSTENMHLEYLVAPMGAKNSRSILIALMHLVLCGLSPQHVISYLDDILVASNNMDEHLFYLDQVLSAVERAGLKLNPAKCNIAQDAVVCLGHRLSKDGMSPDPANIEKIKAWEAPQNVKKLKTFLGLTGYYRQFVKDYAKIAEVLTDLTRDGVEWKWTDDHQKAFEELKGILVSNKVMNYPDFSKPFCVKSDASLSAVGYVLTQQIDGKEKVISYGSKKLSDTQRRWSTYDREFFGLLCAIRANSHYLRHAPFVAITDHRPLLAWRKVDQKKDPTGRRTRWVIELDTYEFELIYKQGRIHADADAMSRMGGEDEEEAKDDEEFEFALLGMSDRDEYSAVRFNAEMDGINQLRSFQDADCVISEARKFVAARKRIPKSFPEKWYQANSRWFIVNKGILYKKAYCDATHSQVLQAVIPDAMRQEVMSDLHGDYLAGHPCAQKMLAKVKRYAIWPSIHRDVEKFAADCKVCDQDRDPVPANKSPRVPLEAQNVWDWVVCDLLKLPTAVGGFQYVLVFMDVFSGFVKLYKLRNKHTEGVCRAFESLICLIGPPRLLTSDNGGEFTSALLESMCKIRGAEKRTSVAYRPQSQGNVERFNRTLITSLRKRLMQHGNSWVDHLPYVEWAYNTTPRANDNMSPYLLMYGREPPLPTFVEVDEKSIVDKNLRKYFEGVKLRSKEIYDEARRRMILAREQDVKASDRKMKHKPLEPGEKVYEEVPASLRTKLQPKWNNPMKVVRCRPGPKGDSGTTYECERDDGSRCVRNYEQLKRARVPNTGVDGQNVSMVAPPTPPVTRRSRRHSTGQIGPTDDDDQAWIAAMPLRHPHVPALAAPIPAIGAPVAVVPAIASPPPVAAALAFAGGSPPLAMPTVSPPLGMLSAAPLVPIAAPTSPVVARPTTPTTIMEELAAALVAPPISGRSTMSTPTRASSPAPEDAHLAETAPSSPSEEEAPGFSEAGEDAEALEPSTAPVTTRREAIEDSMDAVTVGSFGTSTEIVNASVVPFEYTDHLQLKEILGSNLLPTHADDDGSSQDEALSGPSGNSSERGKGKGKGSSKNKALTNSLTLRHTNDNGMLTRRRRLLMQQKEERMKRTTMKLLATSKSLLEGEESDDNIVDEQGVVPEKPICDFSANDLIRQKVANPEAFDETPPVPNNEMVTVEAPPQEVPSSVLADLTSTWTLSLNPFSSIFMPISDRARANNATEVPSANTGRVHSVTEEGCASPQLSSTPNQPK